MADLILTARGRGFNNQQYDLRAVERILSNYRMMLDATVPLVIGQRVMTERLRAQLDYRSRFQPGSLQIVTELVLPAGALIAGLIAEHGYPIAAQVSRLLNAIVELRRIWSRYAEAGKTPTVLPAPDVPGDAGRVSIHLEHIENSGTLIVSPIVLIGARQSKASLDRLIGSVDGEVLESLRLASPNADYAVELTSDDTALTRPLTEELPEFVSLNGRLDVVQFNSRKGQIVTADGRFPVSWDEDLRDKVRTHADHDGIVFRARPVVDHRRFGAEPIGYHLLNLWNPQERLDL